MDTELGNFEIPIIDISNALSKDPEIRKGLVEEIRNACISFGFFYVKNHNIEDLVIQDALDASKQYFELSTNTKMGLDHRKTPNFRGYHPALRVRADSGPDHVEDSQEGFGVGFEGLDGSRPTREQVGEMAGANVWPAELPGFRHNVLKYYHAVLALGRQLFPLFALALDLPETYFADKTVHSAAFMKLLHYPPQTDSTNDRIRGLGTHTDWECFTILCQQPGIQALQIKNFRNEWINAPPIPGTLLINLGDQFQRWTNDTFKSSMHRVIHQTPVDRHAIALFFGTDRTVKLEPIPGCISLERPPRYEVITAGEYIKLHFEAYKHKSADA